MSKSDELASYDSVVKDIRQVLEDGRKRAAVHINHELLATYWEVGRIIVEHEQKNPDRAEYGTATLKRLSRELTEEFGKGFSVSNLQFMRRFHLAYQKQQTVSVELSWSHYCELLVISDPDRRSFYEREAARAKWSVRELKRQIRTSLYERLLLSSGDINKQKILSLAREGAEPTNPSELIKDPYMFEFLGLPDEEPLVEADLERTLIAHLQKFLLELGRGFMFVGTQQRITLNNVHYHVDLVFYNKILRAYVLIELKAGKFLPEAVGQINMYLNYYAQEVNDAYDNPPIGIILCTDKDKVAVEYALGGLQNNIFASQYVSCVPDQTQLVQQVKKALDAWEHGREEP